MGEIQFTALLQPRGPAAAVVLDDAQVAAVGEGAKRFPVVATVNGYTWRTSVARMGGEFLLGLNKEVRQGAGDFRSGRRNHQHRDGLDFGLHPSFGAGYGEQA